MAVEPHGCREAQPTTTGVRNQVPKREEKEENFLYLEVLSIQVSPACNGHAHPGH